MTEQKKMRGKGNRGGFSLVELLVAMTILAVVVAIVMGFFVRATGMYNRGSRESGLQNEAQLTMTRLQSLIVNASHGCSVADPAASPLPGAGAAVLTGKDLFVYNRKEVSMGSYVDGQYDITHIYQDGTQLLYCHRTYTLDASGASSISADKQNPQVLSEFISDFNVDLNQLVQKNAVEIQVDFKNRDKSYTTKNTFLLRNAVVKNATGGADDYFKEDAAADRKKQITAIAISPSDVYMWQGSSLANPFSVTATADGKNYTGTRVVWNIAGPDGVNATISRTTGLITVGDDVTGDLIVEATAQSSINAAGGDKTKYVSATATVHIKSYEGAALTEPQPMSDDNHKFYLSEFSAIGNNLEKDVDMAASPYVAAGSTVSATFEALPDASGSKGLRWKVNVRRPANYLNRTFTLVVGYTLKGKTHTARIDGIQFTPSAGESGAKIAAVRLWDASTSTAYEAEGLVGVNALRGDSKTIEFQVQFEGSTEWTAMEANDWSIVSDNPNVSVKENMLDYELGFSVKDYTKTVYANLTTTYTDNEGNSVEGPGIRLTFAPVKIRLSGVTGSQKKFPVTRGGTDSMSFIIENLKDAQISLTNGDAGGRSTMYVAIDGTNASVTVGTTQSQTKTFSFCVKTAGGELLSDVTCELSFVPGDANVFQDTNGNLSNMFIPKGSEITSYDSQLTPPSGGSETTVLYTVSGKKLIYSRASNKYHVVYEGKSYVYDTIRRGWMPE